MIEQKKKSMDFQSGGIISLLCGEIVESRLCIRKHTSTENHVGRSKTGNHKEYLKGVERPLSRRCYKDQRSETLEMNYEWNHGTRDGN